MEPTFLASSSSNHQQQQQQHTSNKNNNNNNNNNNIRDSKEDDLVIGSIVLDRQHNCKNNSKSDVPEEGNPAFVAAGVEPSGSLDSESVQSGVSSISNEGTNNNNNINNEGYVSAGSANRKSNSNSIGEKSYSYSYFPRFATTTTRTTTTTQRAMMMMDTAVAHSRKHASRLAVPAGSDLFASSTPRKPGGLSSASGNLGATTTTSTTPTLTLSAWQYWTRLTDVRQMDLQSALDQMKTLLSTRPQVVYKTSYYRKQTKNHWARDDPAFLFLQGLFLVVAAIAYSVAFRISFTGTISFLLYTVVWNWLGMGIALATLCREIANRQLVGQQTATSNSHVRQQVEWLYAFDIHCNSFFPVFVLLYGVQFFLLPLVLGEGWLPLVLANALYAVALSWYWYITHLGYRSLPFLGNTEVFLFPIAAIALVFVGSLVGYPFGFGWNAARVMARFYFM